MSKQNSLNKNIFELDINWINEVQINLSAVERRTSSLTKRRTVKKDFQVAWLLKAITMLDLTTLNGDISLYGTGLELNGREDGIEFGSPVSEPFDISGTDDKNELELNTLPKAALFTPDTIMSSKRCPSSF